MQNQQTNQGPRVPFQDTRENLQIATGIMHILAMPLSIWTRRFGTWGERYANHQMAMGWIVMPSFILFDPKSDPRPLIAAWFATTFWLLLHRIEGIRRRRFKGLWVHSQYSGTSWVPGNEWFAKSMVEPVLAIVCGGFAALYCPPLGIWLLTAGFCQGVTVSMARDAERARIRSAKDARFQAEYEMEILRREMGE